MCSPLCCPTLLPEGSELSFHPLVPLLYSLNDTVKHTLQQSMLSVLAHDSSALCWSLSTSARYSTNVCWPICTCVSVNLGDVKSKEIMGGAYSTPCLFLCLPCPFPFRVLGDRARVSSKSSRQESKHGFTLLSTGVSVCGTLPTTSTPEFWARGSGIGLKLCI